MANGGRSNATGSLRARGGATTPPTDTSGLGHFTMEQQLLHHESSIFRFIIYRKAGFGPVGYQRCCWKLI